MIQKNETIENRKNQDKELLIELLKKTPIIQVCCEKTGISRATYYRWRQEDADFAGQANQALQEGANLINDMAESQLISAIKDKNMTAVIYWLKNHHIIYKNKLEISGKVEVDDGKLSPEQQVFHKKALMLAGLISQEQYDQNKQ